MTTRRLFEALFALCLLVIAVRRTVDPDLWWHLRTGEYILANGIPRTDVFSFTVPHHRWITHEWLSQLFMWLVYESGGLPGLMLVFALLIAAAFWLVFRLSGGRPYLAAFVTLLAAFAAAITWGARPQMFNLVLFAAFLYIVERVRSGSLGRRFLWLLLPLTALWVNLHSGYLVGIALLLVYSVGDGLARWLRREPALAGAAWRRLLALIPLLAVAALLNPNGFELWVYPFETLGSNAMQSHIQEWQPPDFHSRIFWPFAALLAAGFLTFALSRLRPHPIDLLLFGGTAAAGLLSARNIPFFALAAVPIICRYLSGSLETTPLRTLVLPPVSRRPDRKLSILNMGLLLAVAAAGLLWVADRVGGNGQAIEEIYPAAAVDYLEAAGLRESRGYNDYGWGGYLIWRGLPVFVDGRADVYGDEFLFYYLQAYDVHSGWRQPLDDFAVTYALLHKGSALATLLHESEGWEETYVDSLAVVFERTE